MKFSTFFSLIVIFGYVGRSWTMSLVEPISYVIQIKYNLPLLDWESSCNEAYKEIKKLQTQAGSLTLIQLPASISAKLPNPKSTEGLDEIIQKDCRENQDVKNIAKNVVSNVKKCTKVEMAKEEEMEKELEKTLCDVIKPNIEWNIQMANVMAEREKKD